MAKGWGYRDVVTNEEKARRELVKRGQRHYEFQDMGYLVKFHKLTGQSKICPLLICKRIRNTTGKLEFSNRYRLQPGEEITRRLLERMTGTFCGIDFEL